MSWFPCYIFGGSWDFRSSFWTYILSILTYPGEHRNTNRGVSQRLRGHAFFVWKPSWWTYWWVQTGTVGYPEHTANRRISGYRRVWKNDWYGPYRMAFWCLNIHMAIIKWLFFALELQHLIGSLFHIPWLRLAIIFLEFSLDMLPVISPGGPGSFTSYQIHWAAKKVDLKRESQSEDSWDKQNQSQ